MPRIKTVIITPRNIADVSFAEGLKSDHLLTLAPLSIQLLINISRPAIENKVANLSAGPAEVTYEAIRFRQSPAKPGGF